MVIPKSITLGDDSSWLEEFTEQLDLDEGLYIKPEPHPPFGTDHTVVKPHIHCRNTFQVKKWKESEDFTRRLLSSLTAVIPAC